MQYKRIGCVQFFYMFNLNNAMLVKINWNKTIIETVITADLFLLIFISYIEYRIQLKKMRIVIIKINTFIKLYPFILLF